MTTFACKNRTGSDCTIFKVTEKDISIVLENQFVSNYYGQNIYIGSLTILNSTMDEIPTISSTYISLTYLSCVGCGLSDITRHSFSYSQSILSHLVTLDISDGSFSRLQKKLFSAIPSLIHLNASHGVIAELDDEVFFNLGKLQNLDLSHNNISEVTPSMFTPLASLLNLDMSFNQIKILDDGLFASNIKLKNLSLSHNDISRIDGRLFNLQCIPSFVSLSYNELSTLDAVNCNVEKLHVNNNRLKQLFVLSKVNKLIADHNIIENVICNDESSQLTDLSLRNNSLSELGCIGSLIHLTKLDLSYNNMSKLNQSSFAALTALSQLYLKSANISKLQYGIFSHQKELRKLDISYNHMGNIAMEILLAARDLQYLSIDGNNITEFSYIDLKKTFSELSFISIKDNDFDCTYLGQVIKHLNSGNI